MVKTNLFHSYEFVIKTRKMDIQGKGFGTSLRTRGQRNSFKLYAKPPTGDSDRPISDDSDKEKRDDIPNPRRADPKKRRNRGRGAKPATPGPSVSHINALLNAVLPVADKLPATKYQYRGYTLSTLVTYARVVNPVGMPGSSVYRGFTESASLIIAAVNSAHNMRKRYTVPQLWYYFTTLAYAFSILKCSETAIELAQLPNDGSEDGERLSVDFARVDSPDVRFALEKLRLLISNCVRPDAFSSIMEAAFTPTASKKHRTIIWMVPADPRGHEANFDPRNKELVAHLLTVAYSRLNSVFIRDVNAAFERTKIYSKGFTFENKPADDDDINYEFIRTVNLFVKEESELYSLTTHSTFEEDGVCLILSVRSQPSMNNFYYNNYSVLDDTRDCIKTTLTPSPWRISKTEIASVIKNAQTDTIPLATEIEEKGEIEVLEAQAQRLLTKKLDLDESSTKFVYPTPQAPLDDRVELSLSEPGFVYQNTNDPLLTAPILYKPVVGGEGDELEPIVCVNMPSLSFEARLKDVLSSDELGNYFISEEHKGYYPNKGDRPRTQPLSVIQFNVRLIVTELFYFDRTAKPGFNVNY